MITVRFPSGFSVQYNTLNTCDFRSTGIFLGRKDDPAHYSVWAPLDCIVEHVAPCRTYFAATQNDALALENKGLKHQIELLNKRIARMKKEAKS